MEPHPGASTDAEPPRRYEEPAQRKSRIGWIVLAVLLAGGAVYWYSQRGERLAPPLIAPSAETPPAAPAATAEPAIRYPLEVEASEPLPALNESDTALRAALDGLIGGRTLAELFHPDRLIRRIVATIDNLPRKKAPRNIMPVKPVDGAFAAAGAGEDTVIAPENARRYAPYARLAQALDTQKTVALYVRWYPLFQSAYEELGYPGKYFNDRLVETLDDLIAAPEVSGPVKLVQRKVLYQFADPALEARSAGQKIMIRMGRENAAIVKAKLREIREGVTQRAQALKKP